MYVAQSNLGLGRLSYILLPFYQTFRFQHRTCHCGQHGNILKNEWMNYIIDNLPNLSRIPSILPHTKTLCVWKPCDLQLRSTALIHGSILHVNHKSER